MTAQTFSNRQVMKDMDEIKRIAREIEERAANKNRIVDLDMRVQMRVLHWLDNKVNNPLRPLGPALAQARLVLHASKLSTRSIGRARDYEAELIRQQETMFRMTMREALQQRIAGGDERAAEALRVFETCNPKTLEFAIGKQR